MIGGRGVEDFVQQLKKQIASIGLEDRISFSGWVPDVQEFYEKIDVLTLCSRHDEGFGLVLAEAGEHSLPVITTASGGAVEIVEDNETGLIVEKRNPAAIASAILKLASDAELRSRMGRSARARVMEEFNVQTQAQYFADLLARTTANSG